jgi:hypothetical protein
MTLAIETKKEPGTQVPGIMIESRMEALATSVRTKLREGGFSSLATEVVFAGEGNGAQCVGVTGEFPRDRKQELFEILSHFSQSNPPRSMAWCLTEDRSYLWE